MLNASHPSIPSGRNRKGPAPTAHTDHGNDTTSVLLLSSTHAHRSWLISLFSLSPLRRSLDSAGPPDPRPCGRAHTARCPPWYLRLGHTNFTGDERVWQMAQDGKAFTDGGPTCNPCNWAAPELQKKKKNRGAVSERKEAVATTVESRCASS